MPSPVVSLPAPGVVMPTALGGTVPIMSVSGPGELSRLKIRKLLEI